MRKEIARRAFLTSVGTAAGIGVAPISAGNKTEKKSKKDNQESENKDLSVKGTKKKKENKVYRG